MRRIDLEHIIRASAVIADQKEIVVVGSQSILGQYPNAAYCFTRSKEADVYPLKDPSLSDVIDGSIGEDSPFYERFGYYAQGVDDTTAILPDGWRERLVKIENENTMNAIGYCLDAHDLAISKYVARRPKDIDFTTQLILHGMVKPVFLMELADKLPPTHKEFISRVKSYIKADVKRASELGIEINKSPGKLMKPT